MQMWNEFSSEGGHSKLVRQYFLDMCCPPSYIEHVFMYTNIQMYVFKHLFDSWQQCFKRLLA